MAPQAPSPPPPPPTPVDQAALDAAKQVKAKFAAAGGLGSTLLTGGQGVLDPANTTNKQLLGA